MNSGHEEYHTFRVTKISLITAFQFINILSKCFLGSRRTRLTVHGPVLTLAFFRAVPCLLAARA